MSVLTEYQYISDTVGALFVQSKWGKKKSVCYEVSLQLKGVACSLWSYFFSRRHLQGLFFGNGFELLSVCSSVLSVWGLPLTCLLTSILTQPPCCGAPARSFGDTDTDMSELSARCPASDADTSWSTGACREPKGSPWVRAVAEAVCFCAESCVFLTQVLLAAEGMPDKHPVMAVAVTTK